MLIPLNTDRHRFIPACAGNSCLKTLFVRASTVHPRLRGELIPPKSTPKKWPGSSPLARGTLIQRYLKRVVQRFIPACAGNSPYVPVPAVFLSGSSPLARGTLFRHPPFHLRGRFIPACAGNSFKLGSMITMSPVHPRLRGELPGCSWQSRCNSGSSPLARETLRRKYENYRYCRFIPACAGNSCC